MINGRLTEGVTLLWFQKGKAPRPVKYVRYSDSGLSVLVEYPNRSDGKTYSKRSWVKSAKLTQIVYKGVK